MNAESDETFTKSDLKKCEDNIATFGNKTVNQGRVVTL